MKENCSLCNFAKNPDDKDPLLIHCDDLWMVRQSTEVNIPGYYLLFPIKHVTSVEELSDNEAASLPTIMKTAISRIRRISKDIERVYICSFNELCPHLHFHLFPRYNWMLDLPGIHTDEKLDAVKLFSVARQQYRV